MRMLVNELKQLLLDDPEVRILFVEGNFDLRLWARMFPLKERATTTIYPIGFIEVSVASGGNKARSLALAEATSNWEEANRIHFFVDRDYDGIPHGGYGARVTITDGRDVESYLMNESCGECLFEVSEKEQSEGLDGLRTNVTNLLRMPAYIRMASSKYNWQLKFQEVCADGSIKRFFKRNGAHYIFDEDAFASALQVTSNRYISDIEWSEKVEDEKSGNADATNFSIVHGKDFFALLAWFFRMPLNVVDGLAILSIAVSRNALRNYPGFREVDNWLRS